MSYNKADMANYIGYRGEVTASLTVNGSTVKLAVLNSGTKYLWDTLAMCLAGYDISNRVPKYLDVVDANSTSVLLGRIMFRGVVWGDVVSNSKDYSSVKFTATITSADKRVNTVTSACNLRMYSISNKNGEFLAEIKDTNNDIRDLFNAIDVGSNAILEWELRFQNQTSTNKQEDANS